MLIISSYFYIFSENLGDPIFGSENILHDLIYLIKMAKSVNSSVYFDFRVFCGFEKIFERNRLLYLENEEVIKDIFVFLFEMYDDFFFEFFEICKNNFLDKKIGSFRFPDFAIVLYYGLKPAFLNLLLKQENFKKIIFSFFEKTKRIFKIIKKIPHNCLKFVFDILKISSILIRFKNIQKIVKINKNILITKYLELILLFLKYQYFEELEKNIDFIYPNIQIIFKSVKNKKNFEHLFYEIEKILNSKIKKIDPKIKKYLKKKLLKKNYLKKNGK